MKKFLIGLAILFGIIIAGTIVDFTTGYIGVFKTRTLGVAQENAERLKFEQTQSYVEGKRQEALKIYKEYLLADSATKISLKHIVVMQFGNIDEAKMNNFSPELKRFIYNCKYK